MLQYNLSCRNCANLVMAINICMHKSNPLVFFLFSSLSLSDCSYICCSFSECMGYTSWEAHSTFPCLTCLESEEVKGYSRRTQNSYLCCPLPHEKTFPDGRRQENLPAMKSHMDMLTLTMLTQFHSLTGLSTSALNVLQTPSRIRCLKKFNPTKEELLLGFPAQLHSSGFLVAFYSQSPLSCSRR